MRKPYVHGELKLYLLGPPAEWHEEGCERLNGNNCSCFWQAQHCFTGDNARKYAWLAAFAILYGHAQTAQQAVEFAFK